MARALADVIPLAVGVALSPLPILAVLLMLLSEQELANARAFVLGWTVTLAVIATVAVLASLDVDVSNPPPWVKAAEVATGVALLIGAVVAWRRRPQPGSTPRPPRWLTVLDEISPVRAGGLGSVLLLLNAKDLALTLAAGTVISDAALSTVATVFALVVFVAIASGTIAIPFAVAAIAGERAEPTLRSWHGWFERNGTAVVAVVLAVAGIVFVAAGRS